MALILGLDPGYKESALVLYGTDDQRVIQSAIGDNLTLLPLLASAEIWGTADLLVVEQMQMFRSAFGVGAEVFDSVFWSGRFVQAWQPRPWARLLRSKVRGHLHAIKGGDAAVRQGLIVRFGGYKETAIGTKKNPGPLYGIKSHMWSALALAVTYADLNEQIPDRDRVVRPGVVGDF